MSPASTRIGSTGVRGDAACGSGGLTAQILHLLLTQAFLFFSFRLVEEHTVQIWASLSGGPEPGN
jgi:hypothetical protein